MKILNKTLFLILVCLAVAFSFEQLSVKKDTVPNWKYHQTDLSHNIAVPYNVTVKFDIDTTLEAGDYIGVFYDSVGTTACAGFNVWVGGTQSINVTAWGDDPDTKTVKEGFSSGETMKWKVFRKKTGLAYDVMVTYYQGNATFAPQGTSALASIILKKADVLPPWPFKTSATSHTIALPNNVIPTISGTKIQDGDFIGVFYDSSGTLACAGYAMFVSGSATAVTAWGNDPLTTVKDGFSDNEVFKWKLWRATDNKQFLAHAYYRLGQVNDSLFVANGMSILDSLISQAADSVNVDSVVVITCDFSFGDGDVSKTANYRMIGLPCNGTTAGTSISLDNSIFYGRTPNVDWIAFLDNGSGDYIAYSEGNKDKFVFTPGKAFWILSKYSFKVNQLRAKPVYAASDGTYNIPLSKGWNMISNPFTSNVDWNSLIPLNGYITDPLWDFNEQGKYVLPSGFLPYRGYYFYNRKGLDSLKIPKPTGKEPKLNASNSITGNLKDPITISLKNNGETVSQAYITINTAAANDIDDIDQFTPPTSFEDTKVYLYNDELSTSYKNLYIEGRPQIGDGQAFDLRVKHNVAGNFTLTFDGLDKYYNYESYLINKRSLKFYNLKDAQVLALSSNYKSDEFILAMGNKEFFRGMQIEIKPYEFALNQNFPNPFNPVTTISWQLVADSRVTLKIFDLLGRELAVLINENQKAGNHQTEFSLDKFKLSSGVYFYQIKAKELDGGKEYSAYKKMIVIK